MMHPGRMKWEVFFLTPINTKDATGQQKQTYEVLYKTRFEEKTWGSEESTAQQVYYDRPTRDIICRRNRRCPLNISHKAYVEDDNGEKQFFHIVRIKEIDRRNGYQLKLMIADINEIPLVIN